MFEVGKLSDESLDSFLAELGKVSVVCHPRRGCQIGIIYKLNMSLFTCRIYIIELVILFGKK
jgi:hypothetical protein